MNSKMYTDWRDIYIRCYLNIPIYTSIQEQVAERSITVAHFNTLCYISISVILACINFSKLLLRYAQLFYIDSVQA